MVDDVDQTPEARLANAAILLHSVSAQYGEMLILSMFPHDAIEGSDCNGIVAAIACSAEDAAELREILYDWAQSIEGS